MKNRNSTIVVVTLGLLLSVASSSVSFAQSRKFGQPSAGVIHRDVSTSTSNYMPVGLIVHIPPVGFDPMTASNSDLAKYGLPPRPTGQTKLAQWKKDFGTVKHWINPTFTKILNQKLDTLSPNGGGWSGLTYDNSSQSRVVGWWVQPTANSLCTSIRSTILQCVLDWIRRPQW